MPVSVTVAAVSAVVAKADRGVHAASFPGSRDLVRPNCVRLVLQAQMFFFRDFTRVVRRADLQDSHLMPRLRADPCCRVTRRGTARQRKENRDHRDKL